MKHFMLKIVTFGKGVISTFYNSQWKQASKFALSHKLHAGFGRRIIISLHYAKSVDNIKTMQATAAINILKPSLIRYAFMGKMTLHTYAHKHTYIHTEKLTVKPTCQCMI